MADSRRFGLNTQLDIEQILVEAENRWLRPAEICEILKNYRKFRIAPEPPNKPPSGSLFLFDRKVLRYFRKDGHNWRKKKDGKTVKEAHERLKAGSVDVLHCYYAHGEDNEHFQRRSYWMLEEDFMHIVLVHYREVKGNKTSYSRARDSEEISQSPPMDGSSVNSDFFPNHNQVYSQTTDTSSLNSGQMSEYEDTESADNHQASSRYHSFVEVQQSEDGPVMNQMDMGLLHACFPAQYSGGYQGKQSNIPGLDFVSFSQGVASRTISDTGFGLTVNEPKKQIDVTSSWEEVFNHCSMGLESVPLHSIQPANIEGLSPQEIVELGQLSVDEFGVKLEPGVAPGNEIKWQVDVGGGSSILSAWPMDQKVQIESTDDLSIRFQGHRDPYVDRNGPKTLSLVSDHQNGSPLPHALQRHMTIADAGPLAKSNVCEEENEGSREGKINFASATKHSLIDICKTEDIGLKKHDSFSRWMSRELGEVDDTQIQSTSGDIWTTDENGNVIEDSTMSSQVQMDGCLLGPSLAQDQLFSIDDFSPNWAYSGLETKVSIMGTFLTNQHELQNCTWSCMFGELEVPAEVLGDGVLQCMAPIHNAGRVPFYVTCSNRLACSEVREFEYRVQPPEAMDMQVTSELLLRLRLGKLLTLDFVERPDPSSTVVERPHINNKISSLLREDENEWGHMLNLTANEDFSVDKVKEQLLQKLLKEKLCTWLIVKAAEDGKGPNVLDKEGQGVIHLVAALGYDWAIDPIVAAGVNVNFRDAHGWTALHWAASYGRERTVAVLVSLDGEPGALTDPTPQFPSGRTPADLASSNGHKGIAGYLAESHLTSHLERLTIKENLKDAERLESSDTKAVQTIAERTATQYSEGDVPEGLSLKDSLIAVRNAAQAAARIHEVFRVHSFHRKKLIEYGDEKFGMSDERALSLISVKSQKAGHHDEPVHTAAIRIQNKFRGWKGRKEFLIIRQRIVKIQALVRGHQVRKHYKKVIWSVGIVEKAILRWRRKRSGLRGFRSEALIEGPSMQIGPTEEDDYDFLREGRKQTEARLEKALARVRSMVQYPEARDQYRRLLNVVSEIQETRVFVNDSTEAAEGDDDLLDLETLLGDDTLMPTAD